MAAIAGSLEVGALLFEDFFRREYGSVYRAAYLGTGSPEAAQDVTQEAFARAYARWRRLRDQPWAGGWVMTTALNLCKKHARSSEVAVPTPDQHVTPAHDARLDLAGKLRQLPLRQRTAVVLFYLGDLPVAQIAHLMKISEGTVKAHLAQAREALRKSLEVADV